LIIASATGHLNIVEYLISKGADITAMDIKDLFFVSTRNSPLICAFQNGHINIIKFLSSKSQKDNIFSACIEVNIEKIINFIDQGIDIEEKDENT
jgi:ankyrin repeat protein